MVDLSIVSCVCQLFYSQKELLEKGFWATESPVLALTEVSRKPVITNEEVIVWLDDLDEEYMYMIQHCKKSKTKAEVQVGLQKQWVK